MVRCILRTILDFLPIVWWKFAFVVPSGAMANVEAHITGTIWKIEVQVGDSVEEGDTVAILESMKMEMPVEAESAGTVESILCAEGQSVEEGEALVVLSD
jgi:acetyl-CoA carboxylase biotin carboxyl carrier protein